MQNVTCCFGNYRTTRRILKRGSSEFQHSRWKKTVTRIYALHTDEVRYYHDRICTSWVSGKSGSLIKLAYVQCAMCMCIKTSKHVFSLLLLSLFISCALFAQFTSSIRCSTCITSLHQTHTHTHTLLHFKPLWGWWRQSEKSTQCSNFDAEPWIECIPWHNDI